MRIVAALGGNALLAPGQPLTAEAQQRNVGLAAVSLAALAELGDLVVTHGNGPQVGLLALQAEAVDPPGAWPLDLLGAESEGMIGYMIERELAPHLPHRQVATLLTQVEVSAEDAAFACPTKPIGPIYTEEEATTLRESRGWSMAGQGDRWRRVVPSPQPLRIIEIGAIRHLVADGFIIVCGGGGGIPVTVSPTGAVAGVEAVIDKDRTAALLARDVGADVLLLLTDVDAVYEDWESGHRRAIGETTPAALAALELDPGSMGPKAEAAAAFVEETGMFAGIGALGDAPDILAGRAGTRLGRLPDTDG